MAMINATHEAQTILGVPAIVDSSDGRLINPEGVNVYFLDADGNICNFWTNPGPVVSVTAQEVTRHSRAHWGSLNGGGMGSVVF